MNAKKMIVPLLLVALTFSFAAAANAPQQDKNKGKSQPKQGEKIYIPKEVKSILQEGLPSRQGRQDIPIQVLQTLYLPAQLNFQIIHFLKIKNSDLSYVPPTPAAPEKVEKRGPQETPAQEAVAELQADFYVFLQFNSLKEDGGTEVYKEVFVRSSIKIPAAGYDPEKEELYSVGYPLPSGRYLLALAVTSVDLKKIGTAYSEFTLPDPSQFTSLDTTPIFFIKGWDQMESVEQQTEFHKDYFTYAVLKLTPNLDRVFRAGENLDIFFVIFGAEQTPDKKYNFEINYEVKKGEDSVLRWTPQTSQSNLISQPLPLKQTVKVTDQKGERTEQRDLAAGSYTLVISLTDLVSKRTGTKTIDFEMK